MDATFKTRPALAADAAAIGELSAQLGYPSTPQQVQTRLERFNPDDEAAFVAEDQPGKVIGWIHVFTARHLQSEPFAELGGLVVDQDYRGKGVGTALMNAAEDWAKRRGFTMLRLRSRSTRTDAHRLYDRQGYSRVKSQIVFDKKIG